MTSSSASVTVPKSIDILVEQELDEEHPGNAFFKQLLKKYHPRYHSGSIPISQRSYILKELEAEVVDTGARFLQKKKTGTDQWEELEEVQRSEKILDFLRNFGKGKSTTKKKTGKPTFAGGEPTSDGAVKTKSKDKSTATPVSRPKPAVETDDYREIDVLLGRGKRYRQHPGNVYFRQVVASYRIKYGAAGSSKKLKSDISRTIISELNAIGSRFLEEVEVDKWEVCPEKRQYDKVAHALRENGVSFTVQEESPFSKKYSHVKIPKIPAEFVLKVDSKDDAAASASAEKKEGSIDIYEEDCLFCRPNYEKYKIIREHPGNKKFDEIVQKYMAEFEVGDVSKKAALVNKVAIAVAESGGRFLENKGGEWRVLGPAEQWNKIQLSLRGGNSRERTRKRKVDDVNVVVEL